MDEMNLKCSRCGSTEDVKLYIIADDIENPVPYCKDCWDKLKLEILFALAENDLG